VTNSCRACGAPATTSWQRHAAEAELRRLAADPKVASVRPDDTEALIPVLACDEHAFPMVVDAEGVERPSDLSAIVHASDCRAPGDYEGACCSAGGARRA
jgi:hypothetical protein